jgi:hypothetical protein
MDNTMILKNVLFALSLAGLVTACGGPGGDATVPVAEPAEATSADIGNHVVHFNAQSTDALSPEIARANDITRSKDMAMLTVSVIGKSDNKPVAADVKVKAVNLTGQLKSISLRKADVPDAIYYIGTVSIDNRETLVFDITVKPDGASEASNVRFKRQFYTD